MKNKRAYQERPDHLRPLIWHQGHITPWQLLRIVSWKSAKGVALLSLNDEESIETVTAGSLQAVAGFRDRDIVAEPLDDEEWSRWELAVRTAIGSKKAGTGLLALAGVGYPVATAVLCLTAPTAFPVIDKWAVQGVFGPDVARRNGWHRGAAYRAFARTLATSAALDGRGNVHERDQFVMQRMMDGKPIRGLRTIGLP